MRSTFKGLVVASAGFAMFVTPAAAADYQDEIREMREMVLQLQDQVEAQQGQIDDQRGVLREAGLEDERGSASLMSSFLESTDFSGWVSASYFYNFNNPRKGGGGTSGANGPVSNPFHPDHHSFQFDEAWFVIDRAATEEAPAGFHFEIVYGATAEGITGDDRNSHVWLPAANVSYMTPFGPTVTAGKMGTTIGYEVAGAANNINITRGAVYNLFQPISQTGITVSQELDSGLSYVFGAVNGFGNDDPDPNGGKGFLWGLGYGNDTVSGSFNGYYEKKAGSGFGVGFAPLQDRLVLDFVGELNPSDHLVLYMNVDYMRMELGAGPDGAASPPGGVNPWLVGAAAGGRMAIGDRYGLGARVEYAYFDADTPGGGAHGDLVTEPITFDVALTDNLTWKLEQKYENTWGVVGDAFALGNTGGSDDAIFLGTQLYYAF